MLVWGEGVKRSSAMKCVQRTSNCIVVAFATTEVTQTIMGYKQFLTLAALYPSLGHMFGRRIS